MDKWLDKVTINGYKIIDAESLITFGVMIIVFKILIYYGIGTSVGDDELLYRPMIN